MPQINTPERRYMLAARAAKQRSRSLAITPSSGPRAGIRIPLETEAVVPAWMNRRTGKPHEHRREKARRGARG